VLFNEPKLLKSYRARAVLWRVRVSVLFNEPKLLKSCCPHRQRADANGFSALQRAEIAEIRDSIALEKRTNCVSVLFNEPKLLKSACTLECRNCIDRFSALQRAEIAEMYVGSPKSDKRLSFSALQRAEIAEIERVHTRTR